MGSASEIGLSIRMPRISSVQELDLLPADPVPRDSAFSRNGCAIDVNKMPLSCFPAPPAAAEEEEEEGTNSTISSFHGDPYQPSNRHPNTNNSNSADDYLESEKGGGGGGGSCSRVSDEEEEGSGSTPRKKLRLSKEQSALLEESFKHNSTLNPRQKQALARQLNLKPRQVEVWFQNRRARTKLKQTEVDCEYLKRCCESLTEENRRLHKELQELKALKLGLGSHAHGLMPMPMPATTLTMCPSCCERLLTTNSAPSNTVANTSSSSSSNRVFSSATHFYHPYARPSSAC
eukprot:TRINITY_DN27293_c0_g1_i1.p1 TRINITY_DN27293_c0_g1~~TRINITY_DN27293_c0_g1_i1.p1  ORF type:complete len:290 (-),score=7.65 TRINITY_DN27293_c0_g1_i1:84-953(-)